ncbi:hypothetical protein FDG2_0526 [Candidatus Protofrankia californiensis]|uniref:ISKra4 family transposase n=1 Tax=Candidatus Protofrankia californiensis TaxID=1839754 RepID=A0A1C3NTQ4_9ACTN|nr:hypothetical protein FDG2_0526 [Candidatus Protofrankia californiensis]
MPASQTPPATLRAARTPRTLTLRTCSLRCAHVEKMIAWAGSGEAHRLEHAALEERAWTDALEGARLLTQAHLDQRARAERRRDDVRDTDGQHRTVREAGHRRHRTTIFGEVETSRLAYRAEGKNNLYPQDADLAWGARSYSAGIEKRVAEAAAVVPFEQVADTVSQAGAIRLGKRQAEQLAVEAAADFEAYYTARRPENCPQPTGLLISCDGSALPVRPDAPRPATAKAHATRALAAAEHGWPDDPADLRRSRTRTAELAAVADIPPAPRTATDVLGALFGPRTGPGPANPPPRAAGRTVFASVARPAAAVIADAFTEADRRDPDHARPWFAVIDGNNHQIETIETLAATRGKNIPILLDLIHVQGYLWKAAKVFFYDKDPAARAWVREQTGKILDGRARDVWVGIRRRATRFGYTATERAGADECADYLERKRNHLDYPTFLAAGWPVASGLIEGAAKWMIKDRMEISGARGGLDGAEAVLRLRALRGNGDLDDYFTFHREQDRQRNHDTRYQPKDTPDQQPEALAA